MVLFVVVGSNMMNSPNGMNLWKYMRKGWECFLVLLI